MCIKHLACNDFSLNVGICIGIFSFLAPSVVTGDATCVLLHSCQAVKCWIRLCLSLWYKYIQWWSYRNVFSKPRQASQPSIPTRVPWRSQQDFLDNCPLDTPLGWLRTSPPPPTSPGLNSWAFPQDWSCPSCLPSHSNDSMSTLYSHKTCWFSAFHSSLPHPLLHPHSHHPGPRHHAIWSLTSTRATQHLFWNGVQIMSFPSLKPFSGLR